MSLQTPSTQSINDNIVAQLQAALNQTIPLLPVAFQRVLAKALAGVFVLLYKYAGYILLQQFVKHAQYADTQINGVIINPLLEWGRLIGAADPTAATQAELLLDITVQNQTGSIAAGTQLIGPTNGVTYVLLTSVLLNAPVVQGTVRAVADQTDTGGAGAIGNLEIGETVSFANSIDNVARDTTVAAQVITGANGEASEAYRQRIIDQFAKKPQGGAYRDYELWGEEVAGIVNVYPYTSICPGQVDVYVEATVASSGSPDGIPTPAQLQAVYDAIQLDVTGLATRRPAGALVNTFPIVRVGFVVTVAGIVVDDLAQVLDDIETGLTNYFLSREPYIVGLSIPPRTDRITRSAVESVVDDIVSAAGGIFNSATLTTSGVLTDVYTLAPGEKAKLSSLGSV